MQGISVFVIDNQAQAIRQSLGDVREAGLIGGALAFIVLFLFLRHWPTTLIVSLAVPLSLLCTLAALYFFGLSINVMSMMGMMLAIGMLVDNAVVVTESVYRHRQIDAAPAHSKPRSRACAKWALQRSPARRRASSCSCRSCSARATRSPSF